MADAAALKAKGNAAFSAKNYSEAIPFYTQALDIEGLTGPNAHILLSNRSACHASLKQYQEALQDADKAVEAKPSWAKGWTRKAGALHGLRRWSDARVAYEKGLELEPDNVALQKGLEEVEVAEMRAQHSASRGSTEGDPFGRLNQSFRDPQLIAKIASNPKTASFLSDPSFMEKLKKLQADPQANLGEALGDQRMLSVLGMLMGVDVRSADSMQEDDNRHVPATPPTSMQEAKPAQSQEAADSMQVDDPPEAPLEEPSDQRAADQEKALGTTAYKKRDFEAAISHYQKAWDLYPNDITYLTNLAAVYFEKQDYDTCIEKCQLAVETGREKFADFKLVAKALGRIGSAYYKKGDLTNAVHFFQKSLTEHRTPEILGKLKAAEKEKAEKEKLAYIDPEKAEVEREEGNKKFKAGDFAGAVANYSEAIKRAPEDARGWTNRATAYTKLMALPEALKDCEQAIKFDTNFIRAYIRKAAVELLMRKHQDALDTLELASQKDSAGKFSAEIQKEQQKVIQLMASQNAGESEEETLRRAQQDPEVASILSDPVFNSILKDAQENPASLADHMKNPEIRRKVNKLVNAGVIKMGHR